MSIIRRVKSFSVKKYNSTDELKSERPSLRSTFSPRPRRKKLTKEKSVSMEYVPLHIELEKSDLFVKQKVKTEEEEKKAEQRKSQEPKVEFRKTKLKKRKSVSFDEARFSKCIEEFNQRDVRLRTVAGLAKRDQNRSRYLTVDVCKDLIHDFENGPKDSVDSLSKPGNFPVPDEEEVQIRPARVAKIERPKTYASPVTKKKEDLLEFRGVVRMEIGKEICVKIRKSELLRLLDGYLQLVDGGGSTKESIRRNVSFKKGAKLIGKKEIEMIDSDKTIYRLYFESTKDAKDFIDIEKSYHSIPSTSAFQKIGAWSQLRKLLKKRASREILESKGIIRNEPIFGNTLEELCDPEHPVPEVITKIIKMIEEPENITSVGLYRASANLAVVQNIRCEINCGRWEILEKHRNDVDVLAGTLKLFFRELKEPLISQEAYQKLHGVIMGSSSNSDEIRNIVDSLPRPNRETLLYIIKHLLKVCRHKDVNKMDLHNISICWGPSLITLPDSCVDIVLQTTEFTKITEGLLSYYEGKVDAKTDEPPVKIDFVYEVVRKITTIIEANIEVEGIYRKSGSTAKIDKIMKQLDKQNLSEVDSARNDIHELCCVLKKYVANVRKSLVPDDFFHRYCDICDTVEDSKLRDEVRRMIAELPRKNVVLLLFSHLHQVVSHERKNKMSLSILSDIWMTTLLAGASVQNYKKKMPKYSKLFLILMNLNENQLPDLVTETKTRIWSKYDNVPDDIHNENETSSNDKVTTKL